MKPSIPFLIGLHGKAGVGKDTFAKVAKRALLYNSDAFAAILRESAQVLFKLSEEELQDRKLKDESHQYWGLSPRKLLQKLGTEGMRNVFGEDFWIRRLELELYHSRRPTFITDVRFQNEVDFILKHGALVHIVRKDNPYEAAAAGHASEADLVLPYSTGCIWLAKNSGTLREFESVVFQVMDSIIAQFNLPKY